MNIEQVSNVPIKKVEMPTEMYAISGHGEVNLNKYLRDKKQDILIKRAIEIPFDVVFKKNRNAARAEKNVVVNQDVVEALEEKDAAVKLKVERVRMIRYAPEMERARLIREALESEEVVVGLEAIDIVWCVPEKERAELIGEALGNTNIEVQLAGIRMIRFIVPEEERTELIRESLKSDNIAVNVEAAKMAWCVPGKEIEDLKLVISQKINDFLLSGNIKAEVSAVKMIRYAPEQSVLIRKALKKEEAMVRSEAVKMIQYAPEGERALLIKEILETEDIVVRTVQREAMRMIQYVLSERERSELIRTALGNERIAVKAESAKMIQYASEGERAALVREAFAEGVGSAVIQSSLYVKHPSISYSNLKRAKFDKTGSGITLIGGSLKDKLIIRHINPKAFLAWQKIYENHTIWKENGFDYVPIEPIQSYKLNEKGLVDVFSGVLDLSYHNWRKVSDGMFDDELTAQKIKILGVIKSSGIKHGHNVHDNNFVLRFFRDKDGNPDITKTPRLYLIDFDQAIS
jgi:hypothetical protein